MVALKKKQSRRKNFSGFSLKEALKESSVKKLKSWQIEATPIAPSEFFGVVLDRLKRFDTRSNERGRELVIDAILAEAIASFSHLKIWKGAPLETDQLNGNADYLITEDRDYLESPYLCAVEAKKDDFEQSLAQCSVEMKACWLTNVAAGREIEILVIVTNCHKLPQMGQAGSSIAGPRSVKSTKPRCMANMKCLCC